MKQELLGCSKPNKFTWRELFLLILVFLGLWLPRAFRLDKFVATDEVVWLWRSANFYYALGQRDYAATYLDMAPGVVTMWVDTIAFLLKFPQYRGYGQGILDKYTLMEKLLLAEGVYPHDLLVTGRVIMVLLNALILTISFFFARRLLGTRVALLGYALIAIDPFHIAVTRLAHLDGPLTSFFFLSLLAFLCYLEEKRPLFLLASAVAGGLAVLAKIPGWIIVPVVVLNSMLWYAWRYKDFKQKIEKGRIVFLNYLILPLTTWAISFLTTILILFPAMWVEPVANLEYMISSPFHISEHIFSTSYQTNGEEFDISEQIKDQSIGYILRYPEGYLWRITPLVLLGAVATLIAFIIHLDVLGEPIYRRVVIGLFLSVVVFTIFLTIPQKSSEKYYTPVYPIMDLLSGVGLLICIDSISRMFYTSRKYISVVFILILLSIQTAQILPSFPYYFTYFNPVLGGSQKAGLLFSGGSGEGLDQAAEYLNNKPNANQLTVMSWYGFGPFSYYFVGKTILISKGIIWGEAETSQLEKVDYLVTYNNQWKRCLPTGLFTLLQGIEPEKHIWMSGIEYARIYNVKAFPPEKFSNSQQ